MSRYLLRDESGIAMGLAVIMIVLIGVMGAGLLVFVQSDLQAVVEVNRGQDAFDVADAGVQAAKRQLAYSDTTRQHYDKDYTNDCAAGQRLGEDWSPTTTGYPNRDCTGTPVPKPAGFTKNFADGKFTVTIECYKQLNDPAGSCLGMSEEAPESVESYNKAFFKITSVGQFPADGSGARRKIEAIYSASAIDVPTGYYTPRDIELSGGVSISGVSFFAGRNIYTSNNVSIDRATPAIYGDWDTTRFNPASTYNTNPRTTSSGTRVTGAGLAAENLICTGSNTTNCTSSVADGVNDYDSTTDSRGSNKRFIRKSPPDGSQTSGQIAYPFNPTANLNLDVLKEEAQRQGNYSATKKDIGTANNSSTIEYPNKSTGRTVMFIDANGTTADVSYTVDYSPKAKGVIVVNNGNLAISNSSTGFNGTIIITGDGTNTGLYKSAGNTTVEGFVIASGKMTIRGTVAPSVGRDFTNVPGFYGVKLWSWRELYE